MTASLVSLPGDHGRVTLAGLRPELTDPGGAVTTTWPAVTDGATMTFNVPPAETAARYDGEKVRLIYRTPGMPGVVWAAGEVVVHGD